MLCHLVWFRKSRCSDTSFSVWSVIQKGRPHTNTGVLCRCSILFPKPDLPAVVVVAPAVTRSGAPSAGVSEVRCRKVNIHGPVVKVVQPASGPGPLMAVAAGGLPDMRSVSPGAGRLPVTGSTVGKGVGAADRMTRGTNRGTRDGW